MSLSFKPNFIVLLQCLHRILTGLIKVIIMWDLHLEHNCESSLCTAFEKMKGIRDLEAAFFADWPTLETTDRRKQIFCEPYLES